MPTGAITEYFDVAQIVLYGFWIFFAGLIIYLHRENKREGYPLVAEDRRNGRVVVQGFPEVPAPKSFRMADGHTYQAPPGVVDDRPVAARPMRAHPGAPLVPTGDPMIDGVGPAAWALREDVPDLTAQDEPRIVPLRVASDHWVCEEDANPVGMEVLGCDRRRAGVVRDLWIDRSEPSIRYFEVEVPTAAGPRNVLLPYGFADVKGRKRVVVSEAITADQFADVPGTKSPDMVTRLEEDRIISYFGGGTLYATPKRQEPLL